MMNTHPGRCPPWWLALTVTAILSANAAAQVPADAGPGGAAAPANVATTTAGVAPGALPAGASPQLGLDGNITFADVVDAFQMGAWSGSIGVFYNGERQTISSSSSLSQSRSLNSNYSRAWEQVMLRNDDLYWLDPQILGGSAGVTLGLTQNWQSLRLSQEGEQLSIDQSQRGTVNGYDFRADILRVLPYNGTLYANRSQSYNTQPFGGNTSNIIQAEGFVLRWGEDSILRYLYPEALPYFSASLEAVQRRMNQNTVSIGGSYRQNEITNAVTLDARNGGEYSDLNFLYFYIDNSDLTYAVNSFKSNEARLNYSLDFGPNLNANWLSLVDYYNRQGAISFQSATVDEQVRVAHDNGLSTGYRYALFQQNTPTGNQLSQTGLFDLQHVLWRNLTTNVAAKVNHLQVPTGTVDQDYGEVRMNFNRNLPWNGHVDFQLGGRYEYDATNIGSGQVLVTDEPHRAPPVLGVDTGFPLANRLVVQDSIVVVDVRGGARLATTVNVDYSVVTRGDQTRIVVLSTSRVIQPNDPLAVSYAYRVGQDAKWNSRTGTFGAGVNFDWFGLRYLHYAVNQTPLSPGAVPFINNVREDDYEANLNGNWEAGHAGVSAAYKDYTSTTLNYQSQTYRAIADYRFLPNLWMTFNGQWYRTSYSLPAQVDTASSARLDVTWLTPYGLTANGYAYRAKLSSTRYADDVLSLIGLKLDYRWRKITLGATLQASREVRGISRTDDTQFMLSIERQL